MSKTTDNTDTATQGYQGSNKPTAGRWTEDAAEEETEKRKEKDEDGSRHAGIMEPRRRWLTGRSGDMAATPPPSTTTQPTSPAFRDYAIVYRGGDSSAGTASD